MSNKARLTTVFCVLIGIAGCVAAPSVPHEALAKEERMLYELMSRRLSALERQDVGALTALYVAGSSEPQQVVSEIFPGLANGRWRFRISRADSFVVLTSDAMARFAVDGVYGQWTSEERVVAVYEKQDGVWRFTTVTLEW